MKLHPSFLTFPFYKVFVITYLFNTILHLWTLLSPNWMKIRTRVKKSTFFSLTLFSLYYYSIWQIDSFRILCSKSNFQYQKLSSMQNRYNWSIFKTESIGGCIQGVGIYIYIHINTYKHRIYIIYLYILCIHMG